MHQKIVIVIIYNTPLNQTKQGIPSNMSLRISIFYLYISSLIFLQSGCKIRHNQSNEDGSIDTLSFYEFGNDTHSAVGINKNRKRYNADSIVGDTVWIKPYALRTWSDTIAESEYTAYLSVWIDTTDFIIDTVRSSKGSRIVIGFNHLYQIDFSKGSKHWFSISLNKKEDFAAILSGTDSWLESNLDVFKHLQYNKKYDQYVVEFNINSRSNFGSLYYIIFNTKGEKKYIGTANSWGGEGPDGEPFLTDNNELFVTCYEIYNFHLSNSITLTEYISMAESRTNRKFVSEFIQIHGMRNLSHNNFLTVFDRFHGEPEFNAFILTTDTSVVSRFSYFGIVEELDAILLYAEDQKLHRSFLYDIDREKLICIKKTEIPKVYEINIEEMKKLNKDSCSSDKFSLLDFDLYGSYEFYVSIIDTAVYYKNDKIE